MHLRHVASCYSSELGEGDVVGAEWCTSSSCWPNKEAAGFLFFLFLPMFPFCSSLSFSGRVAESRWSTCIVCSLPALLQVVQMVVKLHLPSHHLWAFWVIDKWCFYCGSSATDAKNISGVRSL